MIILLMYELNKKIVQLNRYKFEPLFVIMESNKHPNIQEQKV